MGSYKVTTESGTYLVTTEDAPVAEASAPPQPINGVEGATRAIAGGFGNILNGLTLGFGDEIIGGGNAILDYATSEDPNASFGSMFDQRMDQSEQLRKDFTRENPIVGTFGELAGAVNNPVSIARGFGRAGSALGRIAQETGTGAIQGALYGAGENENRVENAIKGGAIGTLFGGAGGALAEGVAALPAIGGRLQRAALGIRQSDVKKAAAGAPKGAPNPLIESFDNLREEGVFAGDKAPGAIQERLTARAAGINDELGTTLGRATGQAPVSSPTFTTARNYVNGLKGTDFTAADDIFREEVEALQRTLDDGGSLQDWQQAKRSLQGNSRYGTDSAELRNTVRTRIASDIRQHIEDVADATIPAAAGDVRALNQNLQDGLRVDEVLERGKNADLTRDPEAWLRSQFRTSGGFGVPMLLAGAAGTGEYNRSGSIKNAIMAGATGAALGTRTGKYGIGALMRSYPQALTPAIATRAATPFFIKNIARKGESDPNNSRPINFFKGGAKGVDAYKELTGEDQAELDNLYSDATQSYKNFVAPNGKVDTKKANAWLNNNKEALDKLPELKTQLVNPENAQRLIDRHFQNGQPVPQEEVEINALKEFMPYEPTEILPEILSSKNPKENMRQTVAYLRSDKEASAGFRRATTQFLNSNPEAYGKNRALLEDGGVFTSSQLKVADFLYGHPEGKMDGSSTLKALSQIAQGSFLGSAPYGKYVDLVSPVLKAVPPEKFRATIESALTNPAVARDLMNKANTKNVTRAINVLFQDEIGTAMGGNAPAANPQPIEASRPKLVIPKQAQVTASKSFPNPKELLNPPASGSLKRTSLDVKSLVAAREPETRARVSVESSGNPFAVSPKGAEGLSQLMPATAQEIASELGETYMPLRPGMTPEQQQLSVDQNLRFGEHYYKKQLKTFKNPTLARAAYNAGPGRVSEAMKMAGSSREVNAILSQLPRGVKKETIPYVQQIAQRYGNV